jgi:hypothetical protein
MQTQHSIFVSRLQQCDVRIPPSRVAALCNPFGNRVAQIVRIIQNYMLGLMIVMQCIRDGSVDMHLSQDAMFSNTLSEHNATNENP